MKPLDINEEAKQIVNIELTIAQVRLIYSCIGQALENLPDGCTPSQRLEDAFREANGNESITLFLKKHLKYLMEERFNL